MKKVVLSACIFALMITVSPVVVQHAAAKCTSSIGNTVWRDDNRNWKQDPGEATIPHVRLRIYDGNDVYEEWTNKNGRYKLKNVCEGTYVVRVDTRTLPAGCVPNAEYDSKPDNKTEAYVKDDDDHKHTKADFGYYCPQPVKNTVATTTRQHVAPATGVNSFVIASLVALFATLATTMIIARRNKYENPSLTIVK